MEKTSDIVVVIPARVPSSRCPGKNLKWFGNTLQALHDSMALIGATVVVTSNHEKIKADCAAFPRDIIWRERPQELLQGDPVDVVIDAVQYAGGAETAVLLQPTSPLRNGRDIDECWRAFQSGACSSLVSVSRVMEDPTTIVSEQGFPVTQLSAPYYFINGAVYIIQYEYLKRMRSFFVPGETYMQLMPKYRSIDVDDLEDDYVADLIEEGLKTCQTAY